MKKEKIWKFICVLVGIRGIFHGFGVGITNGWTFEIILEIALGLYLVCPVPLKKTKYYDKLWSLPFVVFGAVFIYEYIIHFSSILWTENIFKHVFFIADIIYTLLGTILTWGFFPRKK